MPKTPTCLSPFGDQLQPARAIPWARKGSEEGREGLHPRGAVAHERGLGTNGRRWPPRSPCAGAGGKSSE
eukprot:9484712-Pyramimonas_sp.AAC.1